MGSQHPPSTQRLDRWIWCARFVKSRALAAKLCGLGAVTLGTVAVAKAHQPVRVGDHLTLRLGRIERRVEILALADRRGPASEARTLYAETVPAAVIEDSRETWVSLFAE